MMKVIAKKIDVVATFSKEGILTPVKFKIENEDESVVAIKIDRILVRNEEKIAGNRMILYRCQSMINNIIRVYEIKYEIESLSWILFKM